MLRVVLDTIQFSAENNERWLQQGSRYATLVDIERLVSIRCRIILVVFDDLDVVRVLEQGGIRDCLIDHYGRRQVARIGKGLVQVLE